MGGLPMTLVSFHLLGRVQTKVEPMGWNRQANSITFPIYGPAIDLCVPWEDVLLAGRAQAVLNVSADHSQSLCGANEDGVPQAPMQHHS